MSQVPQADPPQAPGPVRPLAAVQRLEGVVIEQGRRVAILEVAGRSLRLEGAPPLPANARVAVDVTQSFRLVAQPARLVAIDRRMLQTPLPVRLGPMPASPGPPAPEPVPAGSSLTSGTPSSPPQPPSAPISASAVPLHRMAPDPPSAARLLEAIQFAGTGPTTSRKKQGGEALFERAASTTPSLAADMTEPPRQGQAGGWRLLLLPFGAEQTHGLKFYLGEDPRAGARRRAEAEPEAARRAVFEVDLSHLGRCQLDALCQRHRFDLIVRSERPFDAPLQSGIRAAFQEALSIAGWSGAIGFHSPDLLSMPWPEQPLGTPVTA